MNARDVFRGRSPNTGLASRGTRSEEAAFQALYGAGAGRGAAPPRIDISIRTQARDTLRGEPGLREHGEDTGRPGREMSANSPVAVLDANAHAPAGPPGRFAAMVAPLAPREFLETFHTEKRPVLFRGEEGRFASLIDWEALNALVSTGLLEPRMKLLRDGTPTPVVHCRAPLFGHGRRSGRYPRAQVLDDRRLTAMLRRGTTLVLNDIQEYHPPIGALADDLERSLGSYAHVNLYASWQPTRGFATHWDHHDVFVLQVTGRKRWHLFGETRRFPMEWDTAANVEVPATQVWNEVLGSGDVLYIPRGWWHDARTDAPAGEQGAGSLHLTCSVDPLTGLDVLEWLKAELAEREIFRRDLPLWSHSDDSGRHFAELRNAIVAGLDGDLARRLRDHFRTTWSERPAVRLDRYIEPWNSPNWSECEIRLRAVRHAAIGHEEDGATIVFEADGYAWRFDRICLELLGPLVDAGHMKVGELRRIAPERFSPAFVEGFAKLLIEEGMATARLP